MSYLFRWSVVWSAAAVVCSAEAAARRPAAQQTAAAATKRTQLDAGSFATANPVPERVRGPGADDTKAAKHQLTGHGHSLAFVSLISISFLIDYL